MHKVRKGKRFHRNNKTRVGLFRKQFPREESSPRYLTFPPPPRKLSNEFFEKLEFCLEALLSLLADISRIDRSSSPRKNRDEREREREKEGAESGGGNLERTAL